MQDSKLIELIKTLSTRQRTRFSEYMHSPFFNKHDALRDLAEYLLKLAPKFPDNKLEKECIYAELFPGSPYEDDTLYTLFSKLLHLLYDFLVEQHFLDKGKERQLILLQELRQRKLGKHYQASVRKYKTLKSSDEDDIVDCYLQDYQYNRERDREFITQASPQYDTFLQERSDALDIFFISEKLRLACDMTSRNIVVKAHYQCRMLDNLLLYINADAKRYEKHPIILIYKTILNSLKQPEQEIYYRELKKLIQEHRESFSAIDILSIYDYALNYCVRKINEGNSSYYHEALELYEYLLEKRILWVDGYLPGWEYKNITTAALRVGRFDWAEWFINSFKDELEPEQRENLYLYNYASLQYSLKRYDKALQSLHEVHFADTSYHLGAKIIQVKSYYELREFEALYSLIDAFTMYLHRNKKLSDYRKEANMLFLRLSKRLARLCEERDYTETKKWAKRAAQLGEQIQETQGMANKAWLVEQCKLLAE